jgi:hypothetical protein
MDYIKLNTVAPGSQLIGRANPWSSPFSRNSRSSHQFGGSRRRFAVGNFFLHPETDKIGGGLPRTFNAQAVRSQAQSRHVGIVVTGREAGLLKFLARISIAKRRYFRTMGAI